VEIVELLLNSLLRRETLHGRLYLVKSATLIVPGVLPGSNGPLFYPAEENARSPGDWDGMPIVLRHPVRNGVHVSARDPLVLADQGLGHIYRTAVDDKGVLGAEAWIDEERVKQLHESTYKKLVSNEPIEVSTGLVIKFDNTAGTYNGRNYSAIARDYKPDHLAILPEGAGACSVADGCGIHNALPNQPRSAVTGYWKWMGAGTGKGPVHEAAQGGFFVPNDHDRTYGALAKEEADQGRNPPSWAVDEELWEKAKAAADKMECDDYYACVSGIYQRMGGEIVTANGFCPTGPGGGKDNSCGKGGGGIAGSAPSETSAEDRMIEADLASFKEKFSAKFEEEFAQMFPNKDKPLDVGGVEEQQAEKEAARKLIEKVWKSIPLPKKRTGNEQHPSGDDMDRNQTIGWLVANCDCMKGKSAKELEGLSDLALNALKTNTEAVLAERKKRADAEAQVANVTKGGFRVGNQLVRIDAQKGKLIVANANGDKMECDEKMSDEECAEYMKGKKEGPPTTTNTGVPAPVPATALTEEQWLASAPPRIRAAVQNSLQREAEEKGKLVEQLTANLQEPHKAQYAAMFAAKDVSELRAIASLPQFQQQAPIAPSPIFNYAGLTPAPVFAAPTVNEPGEILDIQSARKNYDPLITNRNKDKAAS
jgi:hypothetical protein